MTPLPPFQYMLCVCLQELFAAYDKDDSGTISFDELTEGLRAQGYVVNESEVGWRSAVDSEGILGYRSSWVCCMSGGGGQTEGLKAQGCVVNESEVGWRSAVDSEGILGYRSSCVCCMSGGGGQTEGLRAQGYVVNESEVGCGVQHTCMPAVALGDSVGWFPYVSCNMSSIICESRGRCL
jgi:hypothetical protein